MLPSGTCQGHQWASTLGPTPAGPIWFPALAAGGQLPGAIRACVWGSPHGQEAGLGVWLCCSSGQDPWHEVGLQVDPEAVAPRACSTARRTLLRVLPYRGPAARRPGPQERHREALIEVVLLQSEQHGQPERMRQSVAAARKHRTRPPMFRPRA